MIHHIPPRLTAAQAMHARQCLAIHASARTRAELQALADIRAAFAADTPHTGGVT